MSDSPKSAEEVLGFWFSFSQHTSKQDEAITKALTTSYEAAAAGELDQWSESPKTRLALLILIDQVPRHLYRRDARAYATDLKAQQIARSFVEEGDWADWTGFERSYGLLPYLHAEVVTKQQMVNPQLHRLAIEIPDKLGFVGNIADLYLETITTFGYFPHRNPMRGVSVSEKEQHYLDEVWHPRCRKALAVLEQS